MIVLDASAAIEYLLATPAGLALARRLRESDAAVHAPHLIDLEITHAFRRELAAGTLTLARAEGGLADLADMRLVRYPHRDLVARIWALRASITPYDAAYVALAEVLGLPLVTMDARLARSHGHRARVELLRAGR